MSPAIDALAVEFPPPVKRPAPRLDTLNEVETIIRNATEAGETPISLNEVKRRMRAKSVRHHTVRACVDHLKRWGAVWESPRGVEWALVTDPAFWSQGFVRVR